MLTIDWEGLLIVARGITRDKMSIEPQIKLLTVATHLLPARGWGGVAVTARAFFELLAANPRTKLSIVVSDACREKGHIGRSDVDFVHRVSLYSSDAKGKNGFGWAAIPLIIRRIHQSDFVYSAGIMTWPTTLAAIWSVLLRRPFAFHAHGGLLEDRLAELKTKRLKWLLFQHVILPFLTRACFLNCSSEFEAENVQKLFKGPVIITPNYQNISSIPYEEFIPSRRETLCLTFVGRLHQDKGIRRFSTIWRSFARDGDVLQIIGGHDDDYGRKLVAEFSDDPRFVFLGECSRTEVFRLVASSDALVLPSGLEGTLRENFGNVVPEALAVGRPIIISARLAWRDIEDRGVGFFLPSRDVEIKALLEKLRNAPKPLADPRKCRDYAMRFDATSASSEIIRFVHLVEKHAIKA